MISIKNGSFGYYRSELIFDNLNLEINNGEVWAVIGPNGSGKSTFLKTLVGILDLKTGEINGNENIGYVPQDMNERISVSVIETVVWGRLKKVPWYGVPQAADYEVAFEKLKLVGMSAKRDRIFDTLSGGEKQLVMIARGLASESQILVMDEPTSALDFGNQYRILDLIKKLNRKQRLAVVFSTHHPIHALRVADKVLMMFDDKTYLNGAPDAVMNDTNLSKLYGKNIEVVELGVSGGKLIKSVRMKNLK